MILLTDEEICSATLSIEDDGYLPVQRATAKAQLKKVVEWLLELPTDGWDKWHWYNKSLAEALLKEIKK